jgi:pimeloyl-ACP methyl ester carboxylesterase
MKKNYIDIAPNLQLHYRKAGNGFPIVLLHPSPRSSKLLIPFGTVLSEHFEVILPDLFGYGQSDALPIEIQTVDDYLPYLNEAFEKIGLDKFALYGSATGAQIAITFALHYPEKIAHLFLDNAAEFTDSQRQSVLENYFIDVTPQADGSHLPTIWHHIQQSLYFFPWNEPTAENQFQSQKLPSEIEAKVCNDAMIDYLLAGTDYDKAYRAAFIHEKVEFVQSLKVKTTIFRWKGSPVLKYINQLLSNSLPSNIEVVEIESKDRFLLMRERMKEILKQ